ncbi:MAG: hypothetical protein JXR76_07560 [Deltaproteobacteria bacterium]|nr:hypothetical protein [Deltaproteobacteria bacterium]
MIKISIIPVGLLMTASIALAVDPVATKLKYRWAHTSDSAETLHNRVSVPNGFARINVQPDSFANWLRHIPLKPEGAPVMLYNGERKWRQDVHHAVIDIDVGKKDRQQCADAVMRLRAEYLYSVGRANSICFNAVSGKKMCLRDTQKIGFRRYLSNVFAFANTRSLFNQMRNVTTPDKVFAGEVFIEPATGGAYGHAVLVMDVAANDAGERLFLLAQSYMPAQDIHILKNPSDANLSPWYRYVQGKTLVTPEWSFAPGNTHREFTD